jgi:hypothetical protein
VLAADCQPCGHPVSASTEYNLIWFIRRAWSGAIKDYRIEYNPDLHSHSFESLAKKLRIMDDEKVVRSSVSKSALCQAILSAFYPRYAALAHAWWHMKLAALLPGLRSFNQRLLDSSYAYRLELGYRAFGERHTVA